ncbi:hypothetical protein BDF19DRAFT_197186 [Syncephalis fuscata]|nr:hypothetical protein BDF19DRAFT_197186 [Syncephalis fuscata]
MISYCVQDAIWQGMAAIGLGTSYPTHVPNADYHPAIIITGTSSGIGKDAALTLARQGYTVIATVRQSAHIKMLNEEFESLSEQAASEDSAFIHGGSLHPVIMDLAGKTQIAQGWEQIETCLHNNNVPLVALINNAGHGVSRVSEQMDADYWMQALWTNFLGAVELTRLALPRIRVQQGRVINIGSIMSWFAVPCCSSYSAAKAALASWTRILRSELAPFKVAVVLIEPGSINTPGPGKSVKRMADELDQTNNANDAINEPKEYRQITSGLRNCFEPNIGKGIHPFYVTNTMKHAIQSPVPRYKYYVGVDAHLLAGFSWLFGESAIDGLWSRMVAPKDT